MLRKLKNLYSIILVMETNKYEIIINKMEKYIKILNKYLKEFKNKIVELKEYNKKGINVNKLIESINNNTEDIQNVLNRIFKELLEMNKVLINHIEITKLNSKIYLDNDFDEKNKKNKFCCC